MTTDPDDRTLLVPVTNPETMHRLLDTAVDLADDRPTRVLVVHVVEVPPQVPLSEAGDRLPAEGPERQLLADAVDRLETAGVTVESRLRYARDVATGVVGAVADHDADTLLMGWRGRPRRRDAVLGGTLDRVLAEADCDVLVKRVRAPSETVDTVLVPLAGGVHADLAVETAGTIALARDAAVRLLHVHTPDAPETAREAGRDLLATTAGRLEERGVPVETTLLEHDHVAGAITDATVDHDLTILGATGDSFLRRALLGSVAEGVGKTAENSLLLVRSRPESGRKTKVN